ncbi:MAG: hypothetical protein JXB32_18420 [Deltaproteobacteria bacterium]|nr:hypothetical protein [Deltaproteobacteria bacterium]
MTLGQSLVACLPALVLPACSLSTGGVDDPVSDDARTRDDGASGEVGADADAVPDGDAGPDRLPDDTTPDAMPDDGTEPDAPDDDGEPDAPDDDGEPDAPDDGGEVPDDAAEDDAAAEDAPFEVEPACGGVRVGGFCWYAGGVNESCTTACAAHGGCDLAGTRDFAGSGGSDANCVAVVNALGYGSYSHQDWSNNALGCQFGWGSWTYWSTDLPTTCEACIPGAAAAVIRMCACLE